MITYADTCSWKNEKSVDQTTMKLTVIIEMNSLKTLCTFVTISCSTEQECCESLETV